MFSWLDRVHAESVSVACKDHLSGNYKGPCWGGLISEDGCTRTCIGESSENFGGYCELLQCWCCCLSDEGTSRCQISETVAAAAASAPTQQ